MECDKWMEEQKGFGTPPTDWVQSEKKKISSKRCFGKMMFNLFLKQKLDSSMHLCMGEENESMIVATYFWKGRNNIWSIPLLFLRERIKVYFWNKRINAERHSPILPRAGAKELKERRTDTCKRGGKREMVESHNGPQYLITELPGKATRNITFLSFPLFSTLCTVYRRWA